LLLCWLLSMFSLWCALQGQSWGWVTLGFSAGLGLLAKYSMAILGPSVVLVLLHKDWRHHWRQWGPYVAGALALAVFVPNLWWNSTHGMPTLHHTAEISRGQAYSLKPEVMLGFLAEQWLVGNVVLLTAYAGWLLRGGWQSTQHGWFWAMLSAPMLSVIALQALFSRANANWAAPAHVAISMAAVAGLWHARRYKWLGAAMGFNLLFAVLLYHGQTLVREPLGLEASWRTDPYWALRNWPGIHEQARARLSERLPPAQWRVASDDRAVLAQLQWGLKLPAGAAMGWQSKGGPMNHFDQRFPLRTDAGPVLLLTQAGEDEVRRAFPHAVPANPLKSSLVSSEAIAYGAWWLE
jgi:4-amino-4-deoxy-L-arabinose transferase-like glycosyltransferase